jgi:ligand-binding SRPBCC domain-containing protein
MAKLERSITINAPVEKVFNYVRDPNNQQEIWPSVVEVEDVKWLPNGGYSHRFVYKMAGVRFEGTGEQIEYIPNQRFVVKVAGGPEATLDWRFQPEDGGTKLTVEAEYTVPVPVLGKVAEALVVKMNANEAEAVMANLKARMET